MGLSLPKIISTVGAWRCGAWSLSYLASSASYHSRGIGGRAIVERWRVSLRCSQSLSVSRADRAGRRRPVRSPRQAGAPRLEAKMRP